VLSELTLQLTAFPERAWPRFTVADATAGTLPSPLRHAVGVSSLSVIATCIGSAFRPGATVGGVVLQSLAALVGYVGGAASAVELGSRWVSAPDVGPNAVEVSLARVSGASAETARFDRFASGAVLPVVLSGSFNLIPFLPISFVLALAGAAVSVHSGWVGASAMLALEGLPRKRAAMVPAGVAVGLVLLATLLRTVLPK
jgi:hypothetical protein